MDKGLSLLHRGVWDVYEIRQIANEVLSNPAVLNVATFIERMKDRGVKVEVLRDKTPEQKMKTLIYRKGNHSFVASKIGKRFTPNNVVKELNRHASQAEQERMLSTVDPNNQWVHLDGSPVAPTMFGNIEITPEQQQLYVKGYTIHIGDAYIRFNPETKQPDVSRHNLDILTGGGMPFVPGAHPEYEAFYNGLSGFDKEAFKRFRRSHPTLTNQEAISMFKLNYGQTQRIGLSHGL